MLGAVRVSKHISLTKKLEMLLIIWTYGITLRCIIFWTIHINIRVLWTLGTPRNRGQLNLI